MTIGASIDVPSHTTTGAPRRLTVVPDPGHAGSDTLKSVGSALDVLDCFSLDTELGVSDIARRLGIAKSTAHRLLSTLCSRGITTQNPQTGLYRLGLRLYELGTLAQSRVRLRQHALPVLEDVRKVTGMTVLLCVADHADIVVVEQIGGPAGVAELGEGHRRYDAHAVSAGLAIAAFNNEFADRRRRQGFPPRMAGLIRSEADFDTALTDVRRRGVSFGTEGPSLAISSVAAPIRDLNGVAHGAVVVVGLPTELVPVIERTSRLLVTVAGRLSRATRGGGERPSYRTPKRPNVALAPGLQIS